MLKLSLYFSIQNNSNESLEKFTHFILNRPYIRDKEKFEGFKKELEINLDKLLSKRTGKMKFKEISKINKKNKNSIL